jgi:hypothetical protein
VENIYGKFHIVEIRNVNDNEKREDEHTLH